MKRKPRTKSEPAVDPVILEGARRAAGIEKKPPVHCYVCGSDTTPNAAEQLCWVCRRLKISAWRDVEAQIPAQE